MTREPPTPEIVPYAGNNLPWIPPGRQPVFARESDFRAPRGSPLFSCPSPSIGFPPTGLFLLGASCGLRENVSKSLILNKPRSDREVGTFREDEVDTLHRAVGRLRKLSQDYL